MLDAAEQDLQDLEERARSTTPGNPSDALQQELVLLSERLMQRQLALDAIMGDESVRPVRKAQTMRLQRLFIRLERLGQSAIADDQEAAHAEGPASDAGQPVEATVAEAAARS
eukprot:jgi/Mesen1/7864/ME000042S07317